MSEYRSDHDYTSGGSKMSYTDDGGWTLAGSVMGHVQNVLLYGPPGTGKSTFGCKHGVENYYRIICHEEMSDVDILGGPALIGENGGTTSRYQYGAGLRAWVDGERLIIDEIDKAGGAALTALLAILDDRYTAGYTIPSTGEMLRPDEGFHCVATMNGTPQDLPHALRDRFTVRIAITKPHPDAVMSLPDDLRNAARSSLERGISVRGWKAFAQLRDVLDSHEMAAYAVFGATEGEAILDSLKVAKLREVAEAAKRSAPPEREEHFADEDIEVEDMSEAWDDSDEDDTPCTCDDCRRDRGEFDDEEDE